jgi:ribulose-5-phosphate 4-epimerase/fuculose-1-phosphate aldolase
MGTNAGKVDFDRAREDVVRGCRWMVAERLVHATAGNVSVRVPGEPGLIAMTPTATPYDGLEAADVCIVTLDGEVVDGRLEPTVEVPLHTLVYRRRPEVGAIVHAHSPAAMTMAALGLSLPPFLTGLIEATGGAVATAPYARPGTAALADAVVGALANRGACFLRHHGLLAIGADLLRAFRAASVTEVSADVYLRARALGPVPELPPGEADWIHEAWRAQWEATR